MSRNDPDHTVDRIVATGFVVMGVVLAVIAFWHKLSLPTFLLPAIAVGGGTSWLIRLRR